LLYKTLCYILRQYKVKRASRDLFTAENTTPLIILGAIEHHDSSASALPHSYAVSLGTTFTPQDKYCEYYCTLLASTLNPESWN
jgi:hypothetical protein